jgi:hypothetical protein
MSTEKIIALGATAFVCAVIFLAFIVNAWGQIKGTFNYVPPESLIEFAKAVIFTFGGVTGICAGASALVAWRAAKARGDEDIEE